MNLGHQRYRSGASLSQNPWMDTVLCHVHGNSLKYPDKLPDMLSYPILTIQTHMQYEGNAWLRHDCRFRQRDASNPQASWAKSDSTLWERWRPIDASIALVYPTRHQSATGSQQLFNRGLHNWHLQFISKAHQPLAATNKSSSANLLTLTPSQDVLVRIVDLIVSASIAFITLTLWINTQSSILYFEFLCCQQSVLLGEKVPTIK